MAQGGVFGLVTGTIFKIAERQFLSLAGSIPVRLRHFPAISVYSVTLTLTNDTEIPAGDERVEAA